MKILLSSVIFVAFFLITEIKASEKFYRPNVDCNGGIVMCEHIFPLPLEKDPKTKKEKCGFYNCVKNGCTHKQLIALDREDFQTLKKACSCSKLSLFSVIIIVFVIFL